MHLVLFFTRGASLQIWDKVGMFDREVALYQRLQKYGVDVTFVTYGNAEDLQYGGNIPGINICCNHWGLPPKIYERLIPWLHRKRLLGADIIKTNQTNGAEIALSVANHFSKPLIARCGYMWSKNIIIEKGKYSKSAQLSLEIEKEVFSKAQHVLVTTVEMRKSILNRFPAAASYTTIIPNYVDINIFKTCKNKKTHKPRLCFVGRLAPGKNLENLLKAVKGLDMELIIIGEGPLRSLLEEKVHQNTTVHFCGRVPNKQLPEYFHRSSAFVFPSLYEGHPKAPIEAMACGLPVIACDVSGVREVVTHDQTGWLCGTSSSSLREGIKTVLADKNLRKRLGKKARQFVVENYSLDRILKQELKTYQHILRGNIS